MPAEYTVEVEGLEELQERLRRYPQIVRDVVVPAMKRVVITVANNVGEFTPVYRNRLKPAILGSPKVRSIGGEIEGVVGAGGLDYALDMEIGPEAGVWPDMDALERWAHLVLGEAGAAYAVARALFEGRSRVQLRPYAMFARGWLKSKRWVSEEFARARDEIVRRLAGS